MKMKQFKRMPGHLLRRAQQVSTAIFKDEMLEYDLTSVQFMALAAIMENPDIDATRLAELIYFDKATIGGVVERLERKGLIERRPSQADGRVKVLVARPAAKALVQVCLQKIIRVQECLLEPLSTAEREVFLTLLAKVAREDN